MLFALLKLCAPPPPPAAADAAATAAAAAALLLVYSTTRCAASCSSCARRSFTILREPMERIISEYAFLRDRPHFMDRLEPRVTSLRQYILHPQTSVYPSSIPHSIQL